METNNTRLGLGDNINNMHPTLLVYVRAGLAARGLDLVSIPSGWRVACAPGPEALRLRHRRVVR